MVYTSALSPSSSHSPLPTFKGTISLEKAISSISRASISHCNLATAFSSSYPFPELLLEPEQGKLLQDYTHGALEPNHPLFTRLNEKLNQLSPLVTQDHDLKGVQVAYQFYREAICKLEGKSRWKLIKGNVWLSTYIRGRPVSFEISQKKGREIASLNSQNETIKKNLDGEGAVTKVDKIFFKRALLNPLKPGPASAIHKFSALLLDEDLPASLLVKLDNIVVNKHCQVKRVSHILQASKEVAGMSLEEGISCQEIVDKISLKSFSNGFLIDLILLPFDGKGDNFQVTSKLRDDGLYGIRAIDYDNFSIHSITNGLVTCRSIRFILEPHMSMPIHQSYKDHLANLDVEMFLIEWVVSIVTYNETHCSHNEYNIFSTQELNQLGLPMTLSSEHLIFLYDTLIEMQRLFRQSISFTHWDLLQHFQPTLYSVYKAFVNKFHQSPGMFNRMFFPPTKLIDFKKSLHGFLDDVDPPPPTPLLPIEAVPFDALQSFLKTIFPKISSEKQEQILSKISHYFSQTTNIELSNLKIKYGRLCEFVSSLRDLNEMTLSGCEIDSKVGLRAFILAHPDLALTICEDCHFTLNELRKICSFAKRHNRMIIYKVEDKKYPITSNTAKYLYHEAAYNGHVSVIPLLLELGINPTEFDESGNTPLHAAIYPMPSYEFVETLLWRLPQDRVKELCNSKNMYGNTPLHFSVWQKDSRIVDLLIKYGCDINAVSQLGYTALDWAERFNLKESSYLLLSADACANLKTDDNGPSHSLALKNVEDSLSSQTFNSDLEKLAFLKEKYGDQPNLDIAQTLIALARANWIADEYTSAMDYCHEALKMLTSLNGGAPHSLTAEGLRILGRIHLDLENYQKAMYEIKSSLNILLLIDGERPTLNFVKTIGSLGIVYFVIEDYMKAIQTFNHCLSLEFTDPDKTLIEELAQVGHLLGSSWSNLGENQKAIPCYLDSLEKYKVVFTDEPNSSYANALHKFAQIYCKLQEHQVAADYFLLSLNMKRKLKDIDEYSIGNTLMYLGNIYFNLGLNDKNYFQVALKYYQEALEMFLASSDEDDPMLQKAKGAIVTIKDILSGLTPTKKPVSKVPRLKPRTKGVIYSR